MIALVQTQLQVPSAVRSVQTSALAGEVSVPAQVGLSIKSRCTLLSIDAARINGKWIVGRMVGDQLRFAPHVEFNGLQFSNESTRPIMVKWSIFNDCEGR